MTDPIFIAHIKSLVTNHYDRPTREGIPGCNDIDFSKSDYDGVTKILNLIRADLKKPTPNYEAIAKKLECKPTPQSIRNALRDVVRTLEFYADQEMAAVRKETGNIYGQQYADQQKDRNERFLLGLDNQNSRLGALEGAALSAYISVKYCDRAICEKVKPDIASAFQLISAAWDADLMIKNHLWHCK